MFSFPSLWGEPGVSTPMPNANRSRCAGSAQPTYNGHNKQKSEFAIGLYPGVLLKSNKSRDEMLLGPRVLGLDGNVVRGC